jgi:hypothetical protein
VLIAQGKEIALTYPTTIKYVTVTGRGQDLCALSAVASIVGHVPMFRPQKEVGCRLFRRLLLRLLLRFHY